MTTHKQRKVWALGAILLALGLAFAGVSGWVAYAQGPGGDYPCGEGPGWMGGYGMGPGMMGGYGGYGGYGMGPGMMGGYGGYGGYGMGPGMMGGYGGYGMMDEDCPFDEMMNGWPRFEAAGSVNSLDEARTVAERFIAAWEDDDNLALGEVMQFNNQFYALAVERDSGRGAFEFLIDPASGAVMPEYGPNMMWNLRYGMHGDQGEFGMMGGMWGAPAGADGADMPLSAEEAYTAAQEFLARTSPAFSADEEATPFYGYYTLHVLRDGEIVGMLSVNGYTGQVWPHTWHGQFLGMEHVESTAHD